jgi:hypothetical protein
MYLIAPAQLLVLTVFKELLSSDIADYLFQILCWYPTDC